MRLSNAARKLLEEATARYQTNLEHAAQYLAGRGLTKAVADTFRLGFVVNEHPSDADYTGRLAIPYITTSGVIDIRFRSLSPDGPKYLSRPGAKTHLFNPSALLIDSPVLHVCEGEMDTITAQAMCGLPAVGVPGANNWQPHFKLLMQDYERVLVLCDGDEAGRQFGRTVCKEVDQAIAIPMPTGMDVNDLFVQHGADAVRNQVRQ